jgi:hypothetical protein
MSLVEVNQASISLVVLDNYGAGQYLMEKLSTMVPNLHTGQITLLDLDIAEDDKLPAVFLIASVLSEVWLHKKDKKPCHINSIRASLEALVVEVE